MEFSTQAQSIIENLKEFNREEFMVWFKQQRIGTSYVFGYLEWRDRNGNTKS